MKCKFLYITVFALAPAIVWVSYHKSDKKQPSPPTGNTSGFIHTNGKYILDACDDTLTLNCLYSGLTIYGNDIVNNAAYGLHARLAAKAKCVQ